MIETGEVLPRGVCEACIPAFRIKTLKLSDGGKVRGGYCSHNRTVAVIRHWPDGTVSSWRMWSPIEEEALDEKMRQVASTAEIATGARSAHAATLN